MEFQLSFQDHVPFVHDKSVIIVADRIDLKSNIGSLFRMADALGVKELLFFHESFDMNEQKIARIARSCNNYVPYTLCSDIQGLISKLPENAIIYALEWTNKSENIYKYGFESNAAPSVVIIGSERGGISDELLNLSHQSIHIPMSGNNSSMNVIMATAILVYEMIRQRLQA